MAVKHVALFGTTVFLFVLGLAVGFNGTEVEVDNVESVACGSLLTPDDTAAAFKHQVDEGTGDSIARRYAERCEEVRNSRAVPAYSALGLGVIGLFATTLVLGSGRRQVLPAH